MAPGWAGFSEVDPYYVIWGVWITWFVVWEGIALINTRDGDTLSENVWRWMQKGGKGRRRFILLGGVWVVVHFLTRGWV